MRIIIQVTITILFLLTSSVAAFALAEVSVPGADGETAYTFLLNTPDLLIKQLPREIASVRERDSTEFIRLLVQYINENASCDFDRVKKAHDWTALNIRYDTQSYFSGRYSPQDASAVIRRGSAVCAGYSDVFKMICDALEIECIVVNGYARGAGSSVYNFEDITVTNHAWNIVVIKGKRYLIDTTWDAGNVNGRTFQADYETSYLFTDPDVFIYNHFPANNAHQLLNPPISAEELNDLPFLRPVLFLAAQTLPDLRRITEINQGEGFEVVITLKPGFSLTSGWYSYTGGIVGGRFTPTNRREGNVYTITMPQFSRGRYILRIWVRTQGVSGSLFCGEFGFQVR